MSRHFYHNKREHRSEERYLTRQENTVKPEPPKPYRCLWMGVSCPRDGADKFCLDFRDRVRFTPVKERVEAAFNGYDPVVIDVITFIEVQLNTKLPWGEITRLTDEALSDLFDFSADV